MLSRRNLRIKVMQALYAQDRQAYPTQAAVENAVLKSIESAHHCALYMAYFLSGVCLYAEREAEKRASKHLPTKEDLNFNTKIAQNPIIVAIAENDDFRKKVEQVKVHLFDDRDIVKACFKRLLDKEFYQNYLDGGNTDKESRRVLLKTLTKVQLENEELQSLLEEYYPGYLDDKTSIQLKVQQFLEHFEFQNVLTQIWSEEALEEEKEFALLLLRTTLDHREEFKELIEPKLQNWDLERVALLDMLLMQMALSELMYFNNIPVKVSINEYIDISKIYSTPKSKDFINGVLDKIMKELKEGGKIKKTGRGLLE